MEEKRVEEKEKEEKRKKEEEMKIKATILLVVLVARTSTTISIPFDDEYQKEIMGTLRKFLEKKINL